MKKLFSLFSLSMLLFSIFVPVCTYANDDEIDENNVIDETPIVTETPMILTDLVDPLVSDELEQVLSDEHNNDSSLIGDIVDDIIAPIVNYISSDEIGVSNESNQILVFGVGDEVITSDDCFRGIVKENEEIEITFYDSVCGIDDVIIPNEINGFVVTSIGENVFKDKNIKKIRLSEYISNIGTGAFQNSYFDENFTLILPKNLKSINRSAFQNSYISGIIFNDGLEYIGDYAFCGDSYDGKNNLLKDIIIPNSVKYIGQAAFRSNPIESISFGTGLETIGNYAFQRNNMNPTFDEILIPDSVIHIGDGAFQSNGNLKSVIIGNGSGDININQSAFSSCGITDFIINKENITFNGNSMGNNPYENIIISGNVIKNGESRLFSNSIGYGGPNTVSVTFNTSGSLIERYWDYARIGTFNIGPKIGRINTKIVINYQGNTLRIPGNVKYIEGVGRGESMYEKELVLEEGIEEITGGAFQYNWDLTHVTFPSSVKIIGTKAFNYNNISSVEIPEGVEVLGEQAFSNTQIESVRLPNTLNTIEDNAFCKLNYNPQTSSFDKVDWMVIGYVTKDIPEEWINNSENTCINFVRDYVVEFSGALLGGSEIQNQIVSLNGMVNHPEIDSRLGYDFLGWYEKNSETPFDFENTLVTEDKTLYAHWKSLEEKSEENTNNNVTYTNNTTVTVGNETTEEVLSGSSTLKLVTEEVKEQEVTAEEDKTTVKESEIKVTSDKTVEYEGGLEVYLEKTEDVGLPTESTGKVEGTIKFSAPVAVKIPIASDTEYVKVQVKHGTEEFGFKGLTLNPVNECNNGEAVNDKYNGEDVEVKENNNGEKYATIYTCSASTFVAYTESKKEMIPQPSAGGGRVLKNKVSNVEQEHNSADTEKDVNNQSNQTTENKATANNTSATETIETKVKKVSGRELTRGEVAVMTNILLEVYPEIIVKNKGLDDVTRACTSYTDEKDFTKEEKRAITRLCKLSIMGIKEEDKSALEEFMVSNDATNNEFATVINRSIESYNEKDLTLVKEALRKLENDEESVVFGTVYDVFMSIKNIFK